MATRSSPSPAAPAAPPPARDLAALQVPAFLELLPAPGRLTLDLECGSGIIGRLLSHRGHHLVGTVSSARQADAAIATGCYGAVHTTMPPRIPLAHHAVDLVVAWMALDFADDLDAALDEITHVLAPGGTLALAVLHGFRHPVWRPGHRISHALTTTQHGGNWAVLRTSAHRPEAYLEALGRAGLAVSTVTDPCPPGAIPRFLHVTAVDTRDRAHVPSQIDKRAP